MFPTRFALLISIAVVVAISPTAHADDPPPCNTWEIEYATSGHLQISNTMFGAGDGTHTVGPGTIVLHFNNESGAPGNEVSVAKYELVNRFTVRAYVLGLGTTVVNDSNTRGVPNARGVMGRGVMGRDHVVRWAGAWSDLRTDGTLTCSGSVCGNFGAPPHGKSALRIAPHAIMFRPITLAPNMTTLHLDSTVVHKTSHDTASVTLDGRETRRACIYVAPR